MREEYINKIYAGWLAKIIGIRFGAPVEGWTYEKIQNRYGELKGYPVEYKDFAADDDSNGPLFFLRALEDKKGESLEAQDVGNALLNYAPFEHGFFWWGGYGISTEHTAYLNLRNGIPAPRSGSIEQNGSTTAEQIGGQIFIDTWGLVSPGNPDIAAKFAEKAASVTHGGNGVYGGIFVAACIAYAFNDDNIRRIIEKGLSYIPSDCEYAKAVRAVIQYHDENPNDWRKCYHYIKDNWGYAKYPGNCHIIPNVSVMILSLLYGEGDFTKTLCICNMCGWDTDCNCGNVAAIMGVRNGLEGIDYTKWRKPINDLLICSSVIGSLNIMDIPYGAMYIAKLAYKVANEKVPEKWENIINHRLDSCHFELPGSTHAIRIRVESLDPNIDASKRETNVLNTNESSRTGNRCLKFTANLTNAAENIYIYKKTYYLPKDLHDSRYDPSFSPLVYPGQLIHGSIMIPDYSTEADACLYVKDLYSNRVYHGNFTTLKKGEWKDLVYSIPYFEDAVISEMGFIVCPHGTHTETFDYTGLIDDLYVDGEPNYSIDFAHSHEEIWTGLHREISQFTKLKGLMYLADGYLHLSCADFAEAYTGRYDFTDYQAIFYYTPIVGSVHQVNVRVQGAIRSYAFALLDDGKAAILKNENGYKILATKKFKWRTGEEYKVKISAYKNSITANIGDISINIIDNDHPYLYGSIGVSVREGSHDMYRRIEIKPINRILDNVGT